MNGPRSLFRLSEWQNIGRKLPLLTTALLAVAVAVIAGSAYHEMKRVLIDAAGAHLLNVSQQVSAAFAKSAEKMQRDGTPLAHDPLIVAALANPDDAHLAAARQKFAERVSSGQNVTVELWDARHTPVLSSGPGEWPAPSFDATASPVGPLVAARDTAYVQSFVPVLRAPGDTIGFLRETTRESSADSKRLLGGLIGGRAVLLVGNASGDVWTDLDKLVDGPTVSSFGRPTTVTTRDGMRWVGALAAVRGAPWRVWVARPEAEVLEQARAFFARMLLVALVVIALGMFGARLLSRHVIAPLRELTGAAESVARGDYSIRVAVPRRDEVGRLAQAFNDMATAIETALLELENQQVELETQQAELAEANEELRHTVVAVTSAREAEERSHARAAAVVAGAIDGVITIDQDARIVEFNHAAERSFGYSAAEAGGKAITELIASAPGKTNGQAGAAFVLAGDDAHDSTRPVEMSGTRADGTTFPVELATSRIPMPGPPMFTCFVRDLSERKQLEAQLQQAQKMEAIGRLAGGVAHDFNNMLTVIVSYTDLMLADGAVSDSVRGDLAQVRSAADRAAVLTRQLLAFSRKQVLHPKVLDLNAVVGDVITMLARVMPENIRLSSTLGPSLDAVFVDRGQLEQVLMNLAVNARDAMPSGGSLVIETSNAMLDEAYVSMHAGGSAGPHVVLSVRDTGVGMDAKTRDRIFEPFFTTKPVGQGTGLGLATVYGIVQQSGGSIYVYSEPNQGTTFKVYFPAHRDANDSIAEVPDAVAATAAPLTVLLVEDDPAVRDATAVVLKRLGHAVIPTPDAATALEVVRGGTQRFDVVLTDAVMPGQTGLELAEILRDERPGLPVILMSGYAEEAIKYDPSEMLGVVFVEKPFTAPIIATALADVRMKARAVYA